MTPEQLSAITDPRALRNAALVTVGLIASQQAQVAAREAELVAHVRTVGSQQRELDINAGELKNRQLKIDAVTAEITRLKRLQYGAKTEALSAMQHSLFRGAVDEDGGALAQEIAQQLEPVPAPDSKAGAPRSKSTPKRASLPEQLPRRTTVHEPHACQSALSRIGEHASETLGFKPAELHGERHVYPQHAWKSHGLTSVRTGANPPPVVRKLVVCP